MRVQDLEPGMVYRRSHDCAWRICLTTGVEKDDLCFFRVVNVAYDGSVDTRFYFFTVNLEVME